MIKKRFYKDNTAEENVRLSVEYFNERKFYLTSQIELYKSRIPMLEYELENVEKDLLMYKQLEEMYDDIKKENEDK